MKQIVPGILIVSFAASGLAQVIDNTSSRVQTSLDPDLKHLGTLIPKGVHEIETSRWTLGCETIDREYSDYNAFKEYLPALGIRRIRLQGGWARTEKDPGIYDFAWLDQIINDALSRGLEIWLETDYGNPAHEGGGGRADVGALLPGRQLDLVLLDRLVGDLVDQVGGGPHGILQFVNQVIYNRKLYTRTNIFNVFRNKIWVLFHLSLDKI